MNPHLLFFPIVKLQKTSPQLPSTRHLSNPFDCILKRIWERASFGGFCCSFCMSLFCICLRGFYSCNLDIWSPSLFLQLGCGMEIWSHAYKVEDDLYIRWQMVCLWSVLQLGDVGNPQWTIWGLVLRTIFLHMKNSIQTYLTSSCDCSRRRSDNTR